MKRKPLLLILCLIAISALFLLKSQAVLTAKQGPRVQVSVQATDGSGATLRYRWKVTDGVIQNINGATMTWNLPTGPGLHFAYVLVSNGLGGYTERRLAINTDALNNAVPQTLPPAPYSAPPAPAQAAGDYYRSFVAVGDGQVANGDFHDSYAPDLKVYLQDLNNPAIRYPATGTVPTDLRGQYIIPGVAPGTYSAKCSFFGTAFDCTNTGVATLLSDSSSQPIASTDYAEPFANYPLGLFTGSLTLADGSPCGTIDEFFGVTATATATLRNAAGQTLARARVDRYGIYSLPARIKGASILLRCENAAPIVLPVPAFDPTTGAQFSPATIAGVSPPTVVGMSASLNGTPLNGTTSPVAVFLPPHTEFPGDVPPTDFPSNILTRADGFLAVKGVDTRRGACQYYKAIGAVRDCDSAGHLIGAITFDDWQRAVKIDKYATGGVPTFAANYINAIDLNLAREHKSITYGPNQTAAVVCNHLGVPITTAAAFLNPAQPDIDTAVDNAIHNKNLVACVAMDYMVSPGVNNDQPFIRFLIFGPGGQLLPSINLDERGEKFVPGTCIVCHGGDHYAGKFPENGSGFANVGGHFLPYDAGNFEFSSAPGLTKCEQQEAIYNLNQNLLNAGPTPAEKDLVAGWYAKPPSQCTTGVTHELDEAYVAPSWQGISPAATDFYTKVNARTCRTCHVALPEGYNFEHFANVKPGETTDRFPVIDEDLRINLCGGSGQFERDHMMPNSLNTFNRFWLSNVPSANTTGLPNQPLLFTNLYVNTDPAYCATSPGSTP